MQSFGSSLRAAREPDLSPAGILCVEGVDPVALDDMPELDLLALRAGRTNIDSRIHAEARG
jgi:hypothetical protein